MFLCFLVSVPQACLILCGPMDCSPPGSSVHGILQATILEGGAHFLLQIFPTQGSNPGLLHCKQILYHLSHQGSPLLEPMGPRGQDVTTENQRPAMLITSLLQCLSSRDTWFLSGQSLAGPFLPGASEG